MNWIIRAFAAVALLAVAGCIPQLIGPQQPPQPAAYGPATERQVEQSLQRYASLIGSMDAAGVAEMYAPDGVWERQSGALQGRDAIRQAVATAPARILSNEMTTSYLSYNGPAVVQTGEFKQSARLPDGKVVSANGRFEATWMRGPGGEWYLHRMVTRPGR
jgi:uncharacterized protein (TIGR02246 family)